jgi:hypothetical protein
MITAIIVTTIITFALAYAMRTGATITRRPYNNRYSDASGARDDALLDAR